MQTMQLYAAAKFLGVSRYI